MFEGVFRQFRQKVRTRQYVVTVHSDEEMDEDGLTVFDIESAILSGTIVEQQRDRQTRDACEFRWASRTFTTIRRARRRASR